jgi:hypothetical protein
MGNLRPSGPGSISNKGHSCTGKGPPQGLQTDMTHLNEIVLSLQFQLAHLAFNFMKYLIHIIYLDNDTRICKEGQAFLKLLKLV